MEPSRSKDVWAAGDLYEPYVGRWSRRVAREFLNWLAVAEGKDWLDVGCGTGVLTRAVLAAGKGIRATGIDPSETFIAFARRAGESRAEFQVGSVEVLPFPDGAFDATLSLLVLQEFDDPNRAIREMARVTRRLGRRSFREWIRPHLELHNLARRAFAAFHVKRRSRADGRPQAAPFPATLRIVDAAIQPLRVIAHRVWDAEDDPFAVLQHEQPFGSVAGVDRRVRAESGDVEC